MACRRHYIKAIILEINRERSTYLWMRFLQGEISLEEQAELDAWVERDKKNGEASRMLQEKRFVEARLKELGEIHNRKDLVGLKVRGKLFGAQEEKAATRARIFPMWARIAAVTGVGLFLLIMAYWLLVSRTTEQPVVQTVTDHSTDHSSPAPGGNKAILVLGDGKQIVLDTSAKDNLRLKENIAVLNIDQGIITYGKQPGSVNTEIETNTLRTPMGGQYKLQLNDGTVIWLNAASSVTYPTVFSGKSRAISITGEVYLEVAHNQSMPFRVAVNGMDIEVLGTSFNINSYPDEGTIKTTLLEGRVRVTANVKREKADVKDVSPLTSHVSRILSPGQQAQVAAGDIQVINHVDLQQTIAWKNGYFQFYRDDLPTVMRQIARWYDVEVVYAGNIPKREFWGKIHRNTKATEVLKILERYGIHFRIEGKKIIVTP